MITTDYTKETWYIIFVKSNSCVSSERMSYREQELNKGNYFCVRGEKKGDSVCCEFGGQTKTYNIEYEGTQSELYYSRWLRPKWCNDTYFQNGADFDNVEEENRFYGVEKKD